MNVLSLFDGISCGQVALERAGIKVTNYFSSEIDKYAIQVTMNNYPNTIQLGDIRNIKGKDLPKIDLLLGGFPCQSWSIMGNKLGAEDPRGKLFFEYVRLLKECDPKWFLAENVKMKKTYRAVINKELGVEPIDINSNLVSAQNRGRLYWTNIPISPLEDRGVLLKDILENRVDERFYVEEKELERYSNLRSVMFTETRTEEARRIRSQFLKAGRDFCPRRAKEMVPRKDGKANCLTTFLNKEHILIDTDGILRRPTPLECERLQTIPDGYTSCITDRQRHKTLGNGWTVDIIAHILKGMNRANL